MLDAHRIIKGIIQEKRNHRLIYNYEVDRICKQLDISQHDNVAISYDGKLYHLYFDTPATGYSSINVREMKVIEITD